MDINVIQKKRPQQRRPHAMLVRLDEFELGRLRDLAQRWGVPRSVVLRRLIRAGVEDHVRLTLSEQETP